MIIYANSLHFVNDRERINWELANESFILSTTRPNGSITYYQYEISFTLIIFKPKTDRWLKLNSKHIDYNKSKSNIEQSHLLPNNLFKKIDDEVQAGRFCKISAFEIKKLNLKCFESTSYEDYMLFELDNKNEISISYLADYDENKDCYSYPFFKSILDNNNISDLKNAVFTFVKSDIYGLTIAFKVDFLYGTSVITKYYDFSHNPPYGIEMALILEEKRSPF